MRGLIEFMPGKLMQSLLASPSPNVHWFGMHCMQFSKIGLELLAGEDTRADDVKQFKKECLSNTILNFYEVTNILIVESVITDSTPTRRESKSYLPRT